MSSLATIKKQLTSIHIQGAMAVARATLHTIAAYARAQSVPRKLSDWVRLIKMADSLATIRPTEPAARNISRWYVSELHSYTNSKTTEAAWRGLCGSLERALGEYLSEADELVVTAGERLVHNAQTIFTHCHSSLAEHTLVRAHEHGKRFQVYHTESRPLFQGRITDRRLRHAHIKTTMVADSAAPFLISNHSGDSVKVAWLLLGADSIARDGSILNKIGSFGLALAAHDSKIPVYVAAPLLKIDWFGRSTFELRPGRELWPHAPHGAKALNFAFDHVPANYITGLITEFGIIKPSQVRRLVAEHYPWLLSR